MKKLLALTICFVFVGVASGQEWSRKGKSECLFMIQSMVEDSTTVFGFGIGYNVNDHFNLNMDMVIFGLGHTDEEWAGDDFWLQLDRDLYLLDINVDYNILKSRLTPLVSTGIGLISVGGWEDTTGFSYNLGAGLRWDVSDNLFLKATYRRTWTTLDYPDPATQFDGVMVSIGYMF